MTATTACPAWCQADHDSDTTHAGRIQVAPGIELVAAGTGNAALGVDVVVDDSAGGPVMMIAPGWASLTGTQAAALGAALTRITGDPG